MHCVPVRRPLSIFPGQSLLSRRERTIVSEIPFEIDVINKIRGSLKSMSQIATRRWMSYTVRCVKSRDSCQYCPIKSKRASTSPCLVTLLMMVCIFLRDIPSGHDMTISAQWLRRLISTN
ncbi:hypothetical protein CPB86DRAFT_511042 [Serendipita vermifera]|nr:hypothetical protein CPB86DRAFT_511042 [Serendipita vermifera]